MNRILGTKLAWACLSAACAAQPGIDPGLTADSLDAPGDAEVSPLAMRAIAPARAASTTDGERHFVYELAFRSAGPHRVEIARIEVFGSERRRPLLEAEGEALRTVLQVTNPDGTTDGLQPDGFAFAHIDLVPNDAKRLRNGLRHRVTLTVDGATEAFDGPNVQVLDEQAGSLGPPLHGNNLLAVNGCCGGGHARAVLATADGLFVAQRHAIDFVRLRGESTFDGDPTDNRSYYLYGAEVVAVEDGTIVASTDGLPEGIPTKELPPFDPATAAGNHLIQALPDGRFVLYAHLQPQSLRVQQGEQIRRGQVLGLVGNSGNSSEPHLHFQVMDASSPLVADGLPFMFEGFRLLSRVDPSAPDLALTRLEPPPYRRHQLPMAWDVVAFP